LTTATEKETADTAKLCGRETRVMVVIWNIALHKYYWKPASMCITVGHN